MIFLIIGLISFNRKSATGFATKAETVAIVAIVAVVVAASSGGRYLAAASAILFSGWTSLMHLPFLMISFCWHLAW